jgi:hypothetical protein
MRDSYFGDKLTREIAAQIMEVVIFVARSTGLVYVSAD